MTNTTDATTRTATLLEDNLEDYRGHAAIYSLTPSFRDGETGREYDKVIVSSAPAGTDDDESLHPLARFFFPEGMPASTVIIPHLEGENPAQSLIRHGLVVELEGVDDHSTALAEIGYRIA